MKRYKLKLTLLTPVHVGTGENFEPTNYVIDEGYLYEFDEFSFFSKLPGIDRQRFVKLAEQKSYDSLFEIHKFVKERKEIAKEVAKLKVKVSGEVENEYQRKIGRLVQQEGGRRTNLRKVFNRFEIERMTRLGNKKRLYIPASSIKGAISTAFQEMFYKQNPRLWEQFFYNRNPSKNLFKELLIADTQPLKTFSIIGYAHNKERFENDDQGPSVKLEVLYSSPNQSSILQTQIEIKKFEDLNYEIDIHNIARACNEHYLPIFRQQFAVQANFNGKSVKEYTKKYLRKDFIKTYENFHPEKNQFLLRVGKYSQARAVTIDGLRSIRVKMSGGGPGRKPNRWDRFEQETTAWLFGTKEKQNENLLPFGWVLCEIGNLQ